jgi:hypothetical protein
MSNTKERKTGQGVRKSPSFKIISFAQHSETHETTYNERADSYGKRMERLFEEARNAKLGQYRNLPEHLAERVIPITNPPMPKDPNDPLTKFVSLAPGKLEVVFPYYNWERNRTYDGKVRVHSIRFRLYYQDNTNIPIEISVMYDPRYPNGDRGSLLFGYKIEGVSDLSNIPREVHDAVALFDEIHDQGKNNHKLDIAQAMIGYAESLLHPLMPKRLQKPKNIVSFTIATEGN